MVKIRGYRIETSEIETVLIEQDFITTAVVEGRKNTSGNVHLVAYLILSDERKLDLHELRSILSARLPDYMIPAHYMVLDELPMTTSRKVDRKALPNPKPGRPDLGNQLIAPDSEMESKLAAIWERVLEIKPIGIEDNFFDLGGDSLLAAQLFAEIEMAFNKKLPLSILYTAGNIHEQAVILHQKKLEADWSPIVKVRAAGSKPAIFCFPGKGGNPIRFRHLSQHLGEEQPVYMLQSRGLSGTVTPYVRMEDIAADFKKSIQEVQPKGPYYLIGSSGGGMVAYEIAQQFITAGEEVRVLAFVDSYGPSYLKRQPSTKRLLQRVYKLTQFIGKHIANLRVATREGKRKYVSHYIKEGWRRVKGLPKMLSAIIMQARGAKLSPELVEVEKANLKAYIEYQPKPYPGRVILFRASQQPWGIYPDPTLGWGEVGINDLVIHEVPGHHGSILFEPRVGKLAKILEGLLE